MVEIIVREAHPETIVLFRLRARGEACPNSDVDLLIVEREPFGAASSRREEANRLYVVLRHVPLSKDLLLYSRDEVDRWKGSLNHLVSAPLARGGCSMDDLERARSLLRVARRDLNALIGMRDSAQFADEIVVFHAQQAVEKALKAWLSPRGAIYPLTYELPRLLALL